MVIEKQGRLAELLSEDDWLVKESGFEPDKLNVYETLFTVGNGYLGTRGSLEEGHQAGLSATYLAGVFDQHDSTVVDLVNAPDWLPLKISVDGVQLNMNTCRIIVYERKLDLKKGLLYRHTIFEDRSGRRTAYESIRFSSLAQQHLAAIQVEVKALNYSGEIRVESGINGQRRNLDRLPIYVEETDFPHQTKWEKWANSVHLEEVDSQGHDDCVYLQMKTLDRDHQLAYAASTSIRDKSPMRRYDLRDEEVMEALTLTIEEGESIIIEKLVSIGTSRDFPLEALPARCLNWLRDARESGFNTCLAAHIDAWAGKWQVSSCEIKGDPEDSLATRFNIYHILIVGNENDPKVNIGAKSLSGEGYKGHVFWDTEIFLLPFFIYTQPEAAKALLLYRFHCLPAARENARINGCKGAQFPWESADTGEEVTPKWTHDGKHRIWTGEEEIHITSDVAYGVVTYHIATGDWDFILDYGAEMLFSTARYWASRLEFDESADRYNLSSVIGPDEFHEHVNNNVFTNWMAKWNLEKAAWYYEQIQKDYEVQSMELNEQLGLSEEEVKEWNKIAQKIHIPFDREKKLIEQFEGYFDLKEEPITEWDENGMPKYPEGYDHFNSHETTLVKQPDVIMLMYVLPDNFDDEIKRINYEYYEKRTVHKSSLSPSIHCIMGIEVGDTSRAVQYFERSAFVDLVDNQGNTDMGMHAASTGGTWMCLVFGFGGFRVKNGQMTFKPWLPEKWEEISFKLQWHGDLIDVRLDHDDIELWMDSEENNQHPIVVNEKEFSLKTGEKTRISLH